MQLIYTPEAKFFVTPQNQGEQTLRPMLSYFMTSGSGLLWDRPYKDQKTIASQFMCKVEDRHNRILRKLRPFLFSSDDKLFDGFDGVPTHDSSLILHHLVLPAIELVLDYDILVALVKRYPGVLPDNGLALKEAHNDVLQAIRTVSKTARSLNSGNLLNDRPDA